MYTQCPDCESAFRVTARVLQQAAGQVRCGSCGHSFNALDRLSEDPPDADANPSGDRENKELLGSLDELSGPDNVRIEDTGVEWRVLDEELDAIEDAPVQPEDEDPDREAQVSLDLLQAAGRSDEERYDDNTPLPDSLDDDESAPPDRPRRRAEDQIEPRSPEFDERQVDLALSDPGDWTDLLEEVGGEAAADAPSPEVDELADTDIRELDADFPSDIDTQFDLQALELGIDATGSFEPTSEEPVIDADSDDEHAPAMDDVAEDMPDEVTEAPAADDDTTADPAPASDPESAHFVPPQTEEEMTINRLIDQDLLRLAEEESALRETSPGDRQPRNEPPLFETIIMEGESIHHAPDTELPPAEIEAAASNGKAAGFKDTWIVNKERLHDGPTETGARGLATTATAVLLAMLMVAQVVHANRESLATHDVFNQTAGAIYRLFGAPVIPDWNVKGWQVEASNGNTDAADRVLTISSRVANRSEQSLPYPLLHVSLMDRWDEVIGSRVFEPGEYLTGNGDPEKKTAPGKTFNAVITIAPLSPDADGFKLNVCYPASGVQLRCAVGAFKD